MSVQHEQEDFLALLHELEARCKVDPSLNQEWEDARADFLSKSGENVHTENRFREWFLLERVSPTLGSPPAVLWAPDAPEVDSIWHRLLDSFYGIFQGIGNDDEGFPLLEDLWSGRQIRLIGSRMKIDDTGVMVGRVAVGGEEHHVPFPGTAFLIAPGLADALAKDLSSIRAKQPRSRLSQQQCENLLLPYRVAQEEENQSTEDFQQQLRELLEDQNKWDIPQVIALLEKEGPQETLNQIAFDSDIDLEALRHCIHGLTAQGSDNPISSKTPEEDQDYLDPKDVLEALEAFDTAIENGTDLVQSFSALEEKLGFEAGTSDPYQEVLNEGTSAEPVGTQEAPGSAMWMATYLWEQEQMGAHPGRESLEEITHFLEFLRNIFGRNLEADEVHQHQILAYFCQAESSEILTEQLSHLEPFLAWLIEEQGALIQMDQPSRELIHRVVSVNQHWSGSDSITGSMAMVQETDPLQVGTDSGDAAIVMGWPEGFDFQPGIGDALRGQWRHGKFQIGAWFPKALMPAAIPTPS
ncbi:MAG: hypothetical protein O3A95_07625 [Planctomycetota bacterium]|nr:hypothetical protein [Planctomycetota bacterium]MDA1114150.1 hypothetical protein [Planctomycetota bacterium]